MLLSTTVSSLLSDFTLYEAISIIKNAGFDAIDFPFHFSEQYYGENTDSADFKEKFETIRQEAEALGLCFNQAHSVEGSSFSSAELTEKRFVEITRCIRNASYLGAPILVVHPVQHLRYYDEGIPEKLLEMNIEFYNRLKPYCEEYNVKVALENMWQMPVGIKINHSTCSKPEEFIEYLDSLDKRWFVGCLDIGHAELVSEEPDLFIKKLGGERLQALHVHDVDGIWDTHTIPYQGIVNWNKVAKALKAIEYQGDFTYEASAFLKNVPKELKPSGTRFMAEVGRHLIGIADV